LHKTLQSYDVDWYSYLSYTIAAVWGCQRAGCLWGRSSLLAELVVSPHATSRQPSRMSNVLTQNVQDKAARAIDGLQRPRLRTAPVRLWRGWDGAHRGSARRGKNPRKKLP